MPRVVIIDDERPAIRELQYLLKNYPSIEIIGAYTNPIQAMEEIEELIPDVIFLDINMPQLKGIDLAAWILDRSPDTDIVFVTAHDQYAIEAFEIHALDYILKPISRERLDKTAARIINKKVSTSSPDSRRLQIKCFGYLNVGWTGEDSIKWRTGKTRELFAFLLHNRGKEISKEQIIDKLWYDIDVGRAVHQLHNAIYYIRKSLGEYGIDRSKISISGSYCMRIDDVDMDIDLYDKFVSKAMGKIQIQDAEQIINIYAGEYFEGEDWPWAEAEREKLARQYMNYIIGASELYMKLGEYGKAEEMLLGLFKKNPYEEKPVTMLLKYYRSMSNRAKAKILLDEYEMILEKELKLKLPSSIRKLYNEIV